LLTSTVLGQEANNQRAIDGRTELCPRRQ
jgi:hypothetical protein